MDEPKLSQEVLNPVRKSLVVDLQIEAAFRLFTEGIGQWWPLLTHSVGEENAVTCFMDGWVGGRIYEVQKDNSESEWGKVLVWEPPHRLVFSWYPGRAPDTAQKVEVSFYTDAEGTRVELIHRDWERLGERAQEMRDDYDSGWDYVLRKYIEMCR